MNRFNSFFKRAGGQEGAKCRYATRLDTYGCGCSHDCKYCYAKSLLSFRKLWRPDEPRIADMKQVERKLASIPRGTVIRLGGMTDCFQPCELQYKVTYETIKLLNQRQIGYLIVTKSDLPSLSPYIELLDKNLAHIQISVTSTDDTKSLEIEKAVAPSKRMKAIEVLNERGFDVQLRLSPYIDEFIDPLIINSVQCDKILVEFLRVNHWIKQWLNIDYSNYTQYYNGYWHLPLDVKIKMLESITAFRDISVCEDHAEHFAYWRRYVNPNYYDCCNLRL